MAPKIHLTDTTFSPCIGVLKWIRISQRRWTFSAAMMPLHAWKFGERRSSNSGVYEGTKLTNDTNFLVDSPKLPYHWFVGDKLSQSVFENTYFTFFSNLKNMTFYVFFEMEYQKVVKSRYQKFSPPAVKMSSHTLLSDHCNSILSSRSVIHYEPKFPDVMGTYRRLLHTIISCIVSCVRISEQDVWCWWLTSTDFR